MLLEILLLIGPVAQIEMVTELLILTTVGPLTTQILLLMFQFLKIKTSYLLTILLMEN